MLALAILECQKRGKFQVPPRPETLTGIKGLSQAAPSAARAGEGPGAGAKQTWLRPSSLAR